MLQHTPVNVVQIQIFIFGIQQAQEVGKLQLGEMVFFWNNCRQKCTYKKGKFPLVIISHGAGGNAGQFGWLASKLASSGFVVVLPNHPGSTSRNASAIEAVKLWKRPPDLSAVLDEIEKNPEEYSYIDKTKIAVLGFSAGGYTAMAISGALINPKKLKNFCDGGETGMSDCTFQLKAELIYIKQF